MGRGAWGVDTVFGLPGDGVNGMIPTAGTVFTASYRIGNGTAGNVGADSLIYVSAADAVVQSQIQSCRNPLP